MSLRPKSWTDAVEKLAEFVGTTELFNGPSSGLVNEVRHFIEKMDAVINGVPLIEQPYGIRASTPVLECEHCNTTFVVFKVVKLPDGRNALEETASTKFCPFCGEGDKPDENSQDAP